MDTSEPPRGQRRLRHPVALDATILRPGGSRAAAKVTNLSLEGCCLIGGFTIGERLTVELPRIGPLAAEIRWAFMGRAGARFVASKPGSAPAAPPPLGT
ncbi:MAG TPA: PilZ domain-containing protein [Sphingomicrobium sp.]|nr:PilZ domain-containing protein [Sphingomicrobium sp.]